MKIIISISFLLWGIYMLLHGEITNGLLCLILSELIDLPDKLT